MHHHRRHVIDNAWDDYQEGYLSRREVEAIEDQMLADQRREREQLADAKIIVDCRRCGAPIEMPTLAYRGEGRHCCVDCVGGGTTGYRRFVDDEEVSA